MPSALERYRIVRQVEQGEESSLHLVEETATGKVRILKRMPDDTPTSLQETIEREFTGAARPAALDEKSASPPIVDYFVENGERFFVFEHQDERSLQKLMDYQSLGRLLNRRYVVVRGISSGGFGIVYLVRDLNLSGKYWALKEMQEESGISEILEKSFRVEAELLSALEHPSIPGISDFFIEGNRLYLIMDFIRGETLRQMQKKLGKGGCFAPAEVVRWAVRICEVLEYLHGQPEPVVFRDLKPANIMITEEKELKVIDFGIAKVFEGSRSRTTQFALLTEGYAPPEQTLGRAEPRSDIFALGATMFHLLTGVHPRTVIPEFPPVDSLNPSVPQRLAAIVAKAVEPKASARYQSASALRGELEALLALEKAAVHRMRAAKLEGCGDAHQSNFEYMQAMELQGESAELLEALARTCVAMGARDKAVELYRRALDLEPEGEASRALREKLDALESAASAQMPGAPLPPTKEPADPGKARRIRAVLLTGLALLVLALAAAGLAYLERLRISERLYAKAVRFYDQKQYREAVTVFDDVLRHDKSPTAWLGKGRALGALKEYDGALECFDNALRLDPRNAAAWHEKGLVWRDKGNPAEALASFEKALEHDPWSSASWSEKGWLLLEKDDRKGALDCFDRAVEGKDVSVRTWQGRGLCQMGMRKFPDAAESFERAVKADPWNKESWYYKGLALNGAKKYDEAIRCYDKALSLDPKFSWALANKGTALYYQARRGDALRYLDMAIALDPSYAEAWSGKGVILFELGRYREALESFSRCVPLAKKGLDTLWIYQGDCFNALGRPKEALAAYDTALEANEGNAEAHVHRADILAALKRYGEAVQGYDRALQLNASDTDTVRKRSTARTMMEKSGRR